MSGRRKCSCRVRSQDVAGEDEVAGAAVVSIIDDDQSFRESVVDLVRAMGFEAQEFSRAEDFLHSGKTAQTACLITDMRMPGMSGLDLHERLTARGEVIP